MLKDEGIEFREGNVMNFEEVLFRFPRSLSDLENRSEN